MHFQVTLALQPLELVCLALFANFTYSAALSAKHSFCCHLPHRMPNTFSKLAVLGQHRASASAQAKLLFNELIIRYSKHRTAVKRLVIAAMLASTINRIRTTIVKSKKAKPATKDTKLKDKIEVSLKSAG